MTNPCVVCFWSNVVLWMCKTESISNVCLRVAILACTSSSRRISATACLPTAWLRRRSQWIYYLVDKAWVFRALPVMFHTNLEIFGPRRKQYGILKHCEVCQPRRVLSCGVVVRCFRDIAAKLGVVLESGKSILFHDAEEWVSGAEELASVGKHAFRNFMAYCKSLVNNMKEIPARKLEDVGVLLKDSVRIHDRSRVEDMINSLVMGGREKLQIISDFDRTLTKQHVDGKPTLSSFCIFSQCSQLPSGYKEQDAALCQHYRPIEIDPHISREEKVKHMVEWYQKAEKLLSGFNFQTEELEEVIRKEGVELREGTNAMLQSLHAADVPVLVFSAGLGDSVSAVLRYHNALLSNVHIISNYLQFDGLRVNGFQGDIIHSFNKNEHAVEKSDYFEVLACRNNVLLLGDELGDAGMADGVHNVNSVLKIGFLYDRVEERLEEFQKHFDIVLIDDQTMDIVNGILDLVL